MSNASQSIRITYGQIFLILAIILFIVAILLRPFYIVNEGEQVVVTRFGQIINTTSEAGIKLKIPVVDKVNKYSKKMLSWDGDPNRIPTSEKQFIWVDSTARWIITDPAKFYETTKTMATAYSRLDDLIESAIRTIVSQNNLVETVRNSNNILKSQFKKEDDLLPKSEASNSQDGSEVVTEVDGSTINSINDINNLVSQREEQARIEKGRKKLGDEILVAIKQNAPDLGIQIIDIVIRQIRYSDDLTESVYNRMISERKQKAQIYRSFGEGRKQQWLGQLENEKRSILSKAYAESETLKGGADAEAASIYSDAYRQNEGFFNFWRAMESYKKTVPNIDKVLSTNMDYFDYLYSNTGANR